MRTLTIISVILFIGLFSGLSSAAGDTKLRGDAPERYQVVPGDTLWGLLPAFSESRGAGLKSGR